MRYLLALLIVLCAAPSWSAVYYVNAGHDNAMNKNYGDTIYHYGSSPDSPWITPSYAYANKIAGDTIYLYGYSVPSDTNMYYQDVIPATTSRFFKGVSVNGDSPVWSSQGTAINYNPSASNTTIYIHDIRFTAKTSASAIASDYCRVVNSISMRCGENGSQWCISE